MAVARGKQPAPNDAALPSFNSIDALVRLLTPENRELLQRAGSVVWLKAEPETIERRIADDITTAARRPNLTASGGIAEIRHLLIERSPHYAACAGQQFETEGKTPAQVASEILETVRPPQ